MSNKFSDDVGPGQHRTGFGSLTDLGSYPSFATYWLSNLGRVTVTSEPAEGGQECLLGRVPVRIRCAHLSMAPSSLSGNPVSRSQGQSQLRQSPAMHPGASFFLSLSLSFFFCKTMMTVYMPPGLRELSEIIDVKHQHREHIQSARAVVISPVALPMTITGRTCPFSAGTKATVGGVFLLCEAGT